MSSRNAWRWPLQSRGRLIALILAGFALALVTKTILDNGASAAPSVSAIEKPAAEAGRTAKTAPTAVPTKAEQCAAQWAKGPDRDACLYRVYGYTPSPEPSRTTGSTAAPLVVGVPVTTTADEGGSGYVPEADQAAALDVTARFVDAWYAGGSGQAWRDQVTRWADPTLAEQLPATDRKALAGSRRNTEPAMRAFQPGLASAGVGTDAGSLALTLIYTDNGWRVVTATAEPR
jgi:hypothetical protein